MLSEFLKSEQTEVVEFSLNKENRIAGAVSEDNLEAFS